MNLEGSKVLVGVDRELAKDDPKGLLGGKLWTVTHIDERGRLQLRRGPFGSPVYDNATFDNVLVIE